MGEGMAERCGGRAVCLPMYIVVIGDPIVVVRRVDIYRMPMSLQVENGIHSQSFYSSYSTSKYYM